MLPRTASTGKQYSSRAPARCLHLDALLLSCSRAPAFIWKQCFNGSLRKAA